MEYGVFISNEYAHMLFLEHSDEYKNPYDFGNQCKVFHCQLLKNHQYLSEQTFRSPFDSNEELYKPEDSYYWLTRDKTN